MNFKETKVLKNFDFPVACIDMHLSNNGNYLASIGTYKPSVKVHDLKNISQKSNRHLEAEPIKILSLTKNCEKMALLRVDRYIELHVKYGMHERIRIPKLCYDMKYNKFTDELLACGKSFEIYRFNLREGKFNNPYETSLEYLMSTDINSVHGLIGYCGDNKIEFIDQRTEKIVNTNKFRDSFLHLSFSNNGIHFAVGTEEGDVKIFDLRCRNPIYRYKHQESVRKIRMVEKSVISIDKHEVFVYTKEKIFDRLKIDVPINTFEVDGGIIFLGLDDINMRTYYSTDFGKIPEWCNVIKVDENI